MSTGLFCTECRNTFSELARGALRCPTCGVDWRTYPPSTRTPIEGRDAADFRAPAPAPVCPLCVVYLVYAGQRNVWLCQLCAFEIGSDYLERFRGTQRRSSGSTVSARIRNLDEAQREQADERERELLKNRRYLVAPPLRPVAVGTRAMVLEDDE